MNRILNYEDVTSDWINFASLGDCKVIDAKYFEDTNKIRYFVDGKNVVLDYSDMEKSVAEWLVKTFGGDIYMMPRVNNPKGVKTADYLFNSKYYDLKIFSGESSRGVDNLIKKNKGQTENFIIDISNNKLSVDDIIYQIKKIYDTKGREWVNELILIKNNSLILACKRKMKATAVPTDHDGFH